MRTPIDRHVLAAQLQNLSKRGGLTDEERLEREAPLLLKLAERLIDLERKPEESPESEEAEDDTQPDERPVIPRAFHLLEDVLPNFSADSQVLLRAVLNLDRRSGTAKNQRIGDLATQWYVAPRHLLERERGLYQPLADFLLAEVDIIRSPPMAPTWR